MLKPARTTDALPAIGFVVPTCENEIPDYSPSLLLSDAGLDRQIVCSRFFAEACKWGFTCFFDDVLDAQSGNYEHRFYTLQAVLEDMYHDILDHYFNADDLPFEVSVGCALGRLSALALYKPDIAAAAYQSLLALVHISVQRKYARLGNS
ncbi:hypothetical protein KDW_22240 [Dictyobacter vulcani]|uniref:Uncharacterized protein n=1 Tax=Dictyobacter vulcani TaxID=2607529 RepID=A0A5J4KLT3_9CHLR|nr:hypothetical protein [Dictyobacter vulcani]GER88062.1 hypothetical protein KDW_22240 [Dictyobacter vulcani]